MIYRLRNNSIDYRNDFIPPNSSEEKFARTLNVENSGYREMNARIKQKSTSPQRLKNQPFMSVREAHPFYQSTIKARRKSGNNPFRNMQRFDSCDQNFAEVSCNKDVEK